MRLAGWWQERRLNTLDDSKGRHLYRCHRSPLFDHTLLDLDLDLDLDLYRGAASHPKQFMTRKTAMVSIQFGQSLAAL
jgi:hypothetical protein